MHRISLLCTSLLGVLLFCSAGARFLEAAPASKAAHPQANLLPRESGPGIVICEPRAASSDRDTVQFGAGCAVWLQFVVGGQPQFGKTPLWDSLDQARTEISRPDLQLSSALALKMAPILGVTHAAVGALGGAEPHLVLTYRLLQVPSDTSVGTAITLSGTKAQIAAGLPQMARTLVKDLKGTTATLPSSTDLTASDLQFLGKLRWQQTPRTETQQSRIGSMAVHSPAAGLMNLDLHARDRAPHFSLMAQTLITQARNNTLVWGVIAKRSDLTLLPHAAELASLAAHYPGSCNLAVAETYRYRVIQDRNSEIEAAERIVKDAPHNPAGWLTYAATVANVASDLREGRYYGSLSSSESDTLSHLYPRWEAAVQHAVQLDPAFALAWLRLATAASFNSDAVLADRALSTALKLNQDKEQDKEQVYWWALEMYQPKWNDDPIKLSRFAHLAAADSTLSTDDVLKLAPELRSSGYPDLQVKILAAATARQHALLALHPEDRQAHYELAALLKAAGDSQSALSEYQRAVKRLPESVVVHYNFGVLLFSRHSYDEAEAQFQAALKFDPYYPGAYYYLSYCQDHLGHPEEAILALKEALRLSPAYGDAYGALADTFLEENKFAEAIPNYQAALRFGDLSESNYANLTEALDATGQYEQAILVGEKALQLYGSEAIHVYADGSANLYENLAEAYLHKSVWDKALVFSQEAVAFNDNDALAHEDLAESYLGAGRIADAQTEWRKVLTLSSDKEKAVAEGFLKKYP